MTPSRALLAFAVLLLVSSQTACRENSVAPGSDSSTPAANAAASLKPDAAKEEIAFYSDRDGDIEIYVMKGDGSDVRQLTPNDAIDIDPTWSPDGSKIAFAFESNRTGTYQVFVMNADGTGQQQVTEGAGVVNQQPVWSPDGRRIVFVSDRDGNDDIHVVSSRGGRSSNLTKNPAIDHDATWSSDGNLLSFWSDRNGGESEIYIMTRNGGAPTRITTSPGIDQGSDWRPRDTSLVSN